MPFSYQALFYCNWIEAFIILSTKKKIYERDFLKLDKSNTPHGIKSIEFLVHQVCNLLESSQKAQTGFKTYLPVKLL